MGDKLRISWDEFEGMANRLTNKIPKNSFDSILCISSGGLVLGKLMSDKLDLPLAVIAAKAYQKGKESEEKEFKRGGIASLDPLYGNLLLVDDLVHTGTTISRISNHLKEQNGISKIKTATIYIKPSSIFVPDHYIRSTEKWIVFPYEKNEFSHLSPEQN